MTDTLKSICERCIHLTNPRLDFIPEELTQHKEIILRDLNELVMAALAEQRKTVVILAGSILESVLFSFIQGQQAYIAGRRGTFVFDPEQSLDNYVSIFNRWFRDIFAIPDYVVGHRDLVHINRELNSGADACSRASEEILRTLDGLLGQLNEFVAAA